ncbi:tRNA (guanine(37)-N1)-methyltransferase [Euwallacea fornicatus]|uniref:tRNA (guanine(37)-N1)-methyltransferase n=1 Tax=Euwallacea fornicatus TaxID=995702 RepID=UPI00338F3E1B
MLSRIFVRFLLSSNYIPQQVFNYHTMEGPLKPPVRVYEMQKLDKTQFEKVIQVPVLYLGTAKISTILSLVKNLLLKIEKFKSICHTDSGNVQLYLDPNLISKWTDFSQETQEGLKKLNVSDANLKTEDFILGYDNFNAESILRAVLPQEQDGFSSYTVIGRVVHVNLREHLLPYKHLIGEVLYDKLKGCESVVNKVNIIDNTYRSFQMEVLQGSNDLRTMVKENNCRFEFDFSKVYWNSRLSTEHERIVKNLKPENVLFDIFAGVGPFSIPAAKKKSRVFANDLNPESYKWLMHNKKLNKVDDDYFKGFNLDGREFILKVVKEQLLKFLGNKAIFITMNLPALSVEFLDTFIGLLSDSKAPEVFDPVTVYVYCFAKGENHEEIARKLIQTHLKIPDVDINTKITDIFKVRTVSNFKEMLRVTLSLDRDVLVGGWSDNKRKCGSQVGNNKRLCIGDGENGQKQEENQQCFQGSRSEEFKNESQSQSC